MIKHSIYPYFTDTDIANSSWATSQLKSQGWTGSPSSKFFWIWEGNVQSYLTWCAWLLLISLLNHGIAIKPHCNCLSIKSLASLQSLTNTCGPWTLMGEVKGSRGGGGRRWPGPRGVPRPALYSHAHEERLLGRQPWGRILLHQGQGAETKLVNGLVGVQGWKIRVHLAVVLGDVQAVGVDIVTATQRAPAVRRASRAPRATCTRGMLCKATEDTYTNMSPKCIVLP